MKTRHHYAEPTLIEFVGPPGVGKTTIIREVSERLNSKGIRAATSEELLGAFVGAAGIRDPRARNALLMIFLLPRLMFRFLCHWRYWLFGTAHIVVHSDRLITCLQRLCAHSRQLVAVEYLRRHCTGYDVILVDHGTIMSNHDILVHLNAPPTDRALNRFATLVPAPDWVVWVTTDPTQSALRLVRRLPQPFSLNCASEREQLINRAHANYRRQYPRQLGDGVLMPNPFNGHPYAETP